jgi:cytochrome c553
MDRIVSNNRKNIMFSNSQNSIFKIIQVGFLSLIISVSAWTLAAEPAPAAIKADAAAGEALYGNGDSTRGITACVSCHGAAGNSGSGTWPKLAGQHAAYIRNQLKHFKSGERANGVMMGMSMALTEQDITNISAYLSKQVIKPGTAKNKDTITLGQSIYRGGIAAKGVPACAGCHGPAGAGIPDQFPQVGGQWADYTEAQLVALRAGVRKNVQMNAIAAKLSDLEMKAVADYIAGIH